MFPIRHKLPARVLLEKSGPLRARRPIWAIDEHAVRPVVRRDRPKFETGMQSGRRDLNPRRTPGAPSRIRTCDRWLRRPSLYPTELRAQNERAG